MFRLVLEYDGSAFSGWQRQPGVRTVEGVLRDAVAALGFEVESLTAAGRTDAGAHAHGQVVGLTLSDTPRASGGVPYVPAPEPLRHTLNAQLPPDVVIVAASNAPADFHARKDALSRTYRYLVVPRTTRPAVARQYAWQVRGPLDLRAMRHAAKLLEGTHDFAAFGRSPRPGGTTTRTVHSVRVRRISGAIVIDVSANAFLYGMMRSFAGALVAIGEHRMTTAELHALLTTPPAQRAHLTVAPAHGLHQWAVTYPETR
ncbi:MAG TPA: tRNA pseudouridine(38-40) synthase TruA [Candidatus Angelobacter sp.]|jgi:tRNA pseudouridine38-40 synthase|nr:tRNA pseudouridine(38-40) synthase TruA [Candidatus Angelobacter sp.]